MTATLLLGLALAQAPPLEGTYAGTLKVKTLELRLGFTITKAADGSFAATFDSIDQGSKDNPVKAVTLKDGELTLDIPKAAATFVGKAQPGGGFVGQWKQAGQSFPLTLTRVEKLDELKRPQTPKPPFPYSSRDVTVNHADAKVQLAGTLVVPEGDGPFPAVLLVTGSGPQDRDETLFGHKPFLVIADHLARHGIASLRCDDRGTGKSSGVFADATTFDFAADAKAAWAFLRDQPKIDPTRVGIVGHSEGGVVAPLVAADKPDVAFVVLLAGSGVPGDRIIAAQSQLILKGAGADEAMLARAAAAQERVLALVKARADKAKFVELADAMDKEGKAAEGDKYDPKATQGIRNQVVALTSPWYREFIAHDPRPVLARVRCPVLAVNGERDIQVPARENLAAIEKALRDAGNAAVTVREFPGLNHLFQPCTSGALGEYGKIETTVAPEVLDALAGWVAAQKKTGR